MSSANLLSQNETTHSTDELKKNSVFFDPDPTRFIDGSGLTEFSKCPRSWYIKNVLRLVPDTKNPALDFGSALHKAVETFHKTGDVDIDKIVEEYGLADTQDHRNAAMLADAVEEYKTLKELHFKTFVLDGRPVVENSFAIPLGDVIWCGRIDRIIELPNGNAAVLDLKTSSADSSQFWNEFEVSISQTGYLWAASQALNMDVTSLVIVAFFTRKTRTPSRWGYRIFLRDKWQFEEWKTFVQAQSVRIRQVAESGAESVIQSAKFANFASCYSHKFGPCTFCNICRMPPESRPQLLATLKPNTFSPLKWKV